MMRWFLREFQVLKAQSASTLQGISVFGMMVALFPFLLGAWPNLVAQAGPAYIWIIFLVVLLMVMPQLFLKDAEEGGIDFLRTNTLSPLAILSLKGLTLFFMMGVPLVLAALFLSPLYGFSDATLLKLIITLSVSLPLMISLMLFGAVIGASSQSTRGFFIVFLIFPFALPMVLLSLQAIEEDGFSGSFRLLLALILVMIPLSLAMASHMMRDVFAR